jgi:hypothetical protein
LKLQALKARNRVLNAKSIDFENQIARRQRFDERKLVSRDDALGLYISRRWR